MVKIENDCVGCDYCKCCGRDRVKHYYCDDCGEEDVLYQYEDKELCEYCLVKQFEKVEGSY